MVEHEALLDREGGDESEPREVGVSLHRAQRLAVDRDLPSPVLGSAHGREAGEPLGQHALEHGGVHQAQERRHRGHTRHRSRETEGASQREALPATPLLDGEQRGVAAKHAADAQGEDGRQGVGLVEAARVGDAAHRFEQALLRHMAFYEKFT